MPHHRRGETPELHALSSVSADVLQIGAREHYVIPLMLHEAGLLRHFHTDAYAGPGSWLRALGVVPSALRQHRLLKRLAERRCDLPAAKVTAHNALGLAGAYRLRRARTMVQQTLAHHWLSHAVTRAYLRKLATPAEVTIGFRGSDLLFEMLRGRSRCLLDQIDGGIEEVYVVRAEVQRYLEDHPELGSSRAPAANAEPRWLEDIEAPRLRREWDFADRIVCNSRWTVHCLQAQGVPESKCAIIPLAYEPPPTAARRHPPASPAGTLRVGFLGGLTIRKGVHVLCEAATVAAQTADVSLTCAGSPHPLFGPRQIATYAPTVSSLGRIPRGSVPEFLQGIDVLALPSISDGFGIVQLEAMAHGVPVIASERTGEVVEHECNGLVVPAGDVQQLAHALVRLARDHELLAHLRENAVHTGQRFSRNRVAAQWAALVREMAG